MCRQLCKESGQKVVTKIFFKERMEPEDFIFYGREKAVMEELAGQHSTAVLFSSFETEAVLCLVLQYYARGDLTKLPTPLDEETAREVWLRVKVYDQV